ncbi:chondroitinase family polysaccharide lyase [uncultured Draconibacterium sp.]|uniref:chondroitinase family polysaccharide lyase n=1 Tax=uncultured Draconibacterium sp. TaxID=1573823 RepID=UPI003260F451
MKYLISTLLFSSLFAFTQLFAQVAPFKVMEDFEELPTYLKATGKVSIDAKRFKYGNSALKWEWQGNDRLIFNTEIGYHQQAIVTDLSKLADGHGGSVSNPVLEPPRGFFIYIYNEKASQQRIRIQFGRNELVDCEFDFNLNFTGWRTCAVGYDRGDMRGVPNEEMNRVTINAPASGSGTFYFDMMGTSITMNPRTVQANPQLPEIDRHPRLVAQYPHLLYEFSKYRPTFKLEPLTEETFADFRKLEQNVNDIFFPEHEKAKYTDDKIEKIRQDYEAFDITRDGDAIYGRPLIYNRIIGDYFTELPGTSKEKFEGIKKWRPEFGYTLLDMAKLYSYTNSPTIKAELEKMFINLFDYAVDQGFDTGEGLGWIHHYSYIIREQAPAFYLMRDVLEKHGRLEKAIEICRWFYAFNQVYNEEYVYEIKGRKAANADEIQGLVPQKLLVALMQPDSPEKARDIKHFSSYYSNIITAYANALDETYKPDGTFFHHAGHAFGYGGRAVYGGVAAGYLLSGTQYAATEAAFQRMKKVTKKLMACLFTDNLMAPKAFANIRFENYGLPREFYTIPAVLACSAPAFDTEMGALYNDMLQKYSGDRVENHDFWKKKTNAQMTNTAPYTYDQITQLPYSCVTLNRQADDWMIALRTHSKYVYPFESWGKSYFGFPLFIANGYLDVSYPESLDSQTPEEGYWHEGYDFRRWPGVTSVRLPYEKMLTDPGQVRDEGGEYLFSDQAFAGGVETTYGIGVSVFQYKGHDKFNLQGFTGKKSYFFFGNKVLCIGTNITSNLTDYDVETTLFQTALKAKSEKITTSWEGPVNTFPFEKHASKNSWVIDNRGTGFLAMKDTEFLLIKSTQTNPQFQNKGEVSGDFACAFIKHGKAPKNAAYQYLLVANTSEKEMNSLVKNAPVSVIQADENAHIVKIPSEKVTAYAVYKKAGLIFKNGPITSINKQATFAVKESKGQLILAVADPDLNIYDGQDDLLPDGSRTELSIYEKEWFFWPSRPNKVQITLNGEWKIEKQLKEMETTKVKNARIISVTNNQTIVEFECKDGLSAEVLLKEL